LLIAARIITGLFGGVIGSISLAIVADLFPLQQRGRAMGIYTNGFWRQPGIGYSYQSLYCQPLGMAITISNDRWLSYYHLDICNATSCNQLQNISN
jgi:MFS family permease